MRVLYIHIFIALLVTGCGYNRFDPLDPRPESALVPNATLSELRDRYLSDLPDVTDDMIVGGVVTSSDSAENFYKRLMIQQGDVAFELKLGLYDTYVSYHVGQSVVFMIEGLRIGRENGTFVLGAPGAGMVDFINSETLIKRRLLRASWHEPITVPTLGVGDVTPDMAGRLVRVRGGHFAKGGVGVWSGEQKYTDGNHSIVVYTNTFATFANDLLPSGDCDLLGIVALYRDKIQIKLNSSNDATPADF